MVISHIFDAIRLVLNKSRRGFVKKSEITTAVKMAVNDLYNSELKPYLVGGIISSKIKRFVKTSSITLTSGVGDLPTDFVKEITFASNAGKEGTILTQEEYLDRVESLILSPDQDNPIAKIENNKIYVSPSDLPSIDFTYFRTPVDFVYATTVDGDGRGETFNSGASTDIEFPVTDSGEIIRLSLLYLGASKQNQEAASIGQAELSK